MRSVFFLVLALVVATHVGCVPRPKQAYTVGQIARIDSLEELMRINAHQVDHLFSIRYQPVFSFQEKAAAERAGEQIMATATVIRDRLSVKRPGDFTVLAGRLHDQARDLMVAAQADRDADVTTALDDMRDTCKACHKKYR